MRNRHRANKKQKIVQRFRNRSSVGAKVTQKQIDIALTDLVLAKLYNDGDRQPASLEDDILKPAKIKFTAGGVDRLWDILLSTGLVSPVIGFGRSGRLTITNQGYQLMSQFGSYSNFIKKREEEAARQTAGNAMPQFIISTGEDDDTENDEGAKKVARKEDGKKTKPNNEAIAAKKK
ncbi:MAG TPA: hypothetical protein VFL76_01915 [Edaphocola sp.]|nr:hypothetical protein [Edaphocola sp.]